MSDMDRIDRDARLFVAQRFEERSIDFTESDLDAIVSHFTTPVPIKVEHFDSPLTGMGEVTRIYRKGCELWGRISFLKSAWDLLSHMGARRVSVGLDHHHRVLREVSIVRNPRVLTAEVFNDMLTVETEIDFADICDKVGVTRMSNEINAELQSLLAREREAGRSEGKADAQVQFNASNNAALIKLKELERVNSSADADLAIAHYKAEGKITPASEKFARAILVDGGTEVTFSDGGHMCVAEAFRQFITMQPPVVEFAGKRTENDETPEISDEKKLIFSGMGLTDEQMKVASAIK